MTLEWSDAKGAPAGSSIQLSIVGRTKSSIAACEGTGCGTYPCTFSSGVRVLWNATLTPAIPQKSVDLGLLYDAGLAFVGVSADKSSDFEGGSISVYEIIPVVGGSVCIAEL